MAEFDLCVIGGGPGGIAGALRAWDYGKRVCLIERGPIGGAGIHHGALSSKTLWELSKDYLKAIRNDRGYRARDVELDFAHVAHCVDTAILEKTAQLERQFRVLSCSRPGFPGSITLLRGTGCFAGPNRIQVRAPEAGQSRTIEAANILIASGSRPRTLPDIQVDGDVILTSDHIMSLDHFPRSLVIVGAGVVGCEFATIFANFGQTKVYLIDRADRILPFEDEDIARVCSNNLEARGVTIHRRAKLISMAAVEGEVEYVIEHHTGGRERLRVEKAMISVGRIPNTGGLELAAAGVKLNEQGAIENQDTQTTVPHIYAAGDVTYDVALVSVAELEARHAVERMFGDVTEPMSYENLATVMFLNPEVAAIGMNEQTAQERRLPYRVAVYGYDLVSRAIAMRATDGFVKLLVSDDDELKILGLRALGVHASTTIEAVSLMIHLGSSIRNLAELFHPHPAIPEGLQDCVRMILGTSIHKPHVFPSSLRLSRISYDDGGAKVNAAGGG